MNIVSIVLNFVTSILKNVLIAITLILVATTVFVFSIVQLILSQIFGDGHRAWKIVVGYDQVGNITAGGHEDETFSARCHRNKSEKYNKAEVVVDKIFKILRNEDNHCRNAFLKELRYSKKYYEDNKP